MILINTAMFTITHRAISGTGVFYVTLFHEANVAAGSMGLGIAYTFQTFEARCNGKSVSFSQSMVADVPYLISISYDTADDGLSITTVLTVERADTGERLGQLTNTFTEISGQSGKTLTEWIDGHYKLFINSGQCNIDRIGNAWNHLSYAKLKEVKRIEAAIQSPDVDSLEELNELNEDYEALPQIYRLMVKGLEVFNSKFDVAVKVLRDGAYTLSELGGSAGTIGSWGNQVLTMKDNMEGTFIYKMTKTGQSGNHIHSFTLFYNGAEAGNGVRLTFQINNNLTINGTKVPMENVQPDVEYYYLIIARLLKEITPNVIFATTTPVNPKHPHNKNSDIQRFNALVVPHLQAMGIQINDLHALVAEDIEGNICEDLIHLSAKGIELCSQQVVNEIKKCL